MIEVREFSSAAAALDAVDSSMPNLIWVDYAMPEISGIDFLRKFRQLSNSLDVPVVIVTSHKERRIRVDALGAGATDFLTKPIDTIECQARCMNLIRQNEQALTIKDRSKWLEREVIKRVKEVTQREHEILLRLARCGEYRDEETGGHIHRMARYSRLIAEELGFRSDRCDLIQRAAPMHDIGKIGISDNILLKPGKHDMEETATMRAHTTIGYGILKDSPSSYLQMGSVIALSHHERYDGTGYPQNLVGEEIPLPARVVAVADVFDALTSVRPYKRAWSINDALDYIKGQRGKHFDPDCTDAFVSRQNVIPLVRGAHPGKKVQGVG